jgi:hypothetical protein
MALYYYEERTMKAIGSRRCTPPPYCTVELGSLLPQFSKGHKTNQTEGLKGIVKGAAKQ